jgi:hypothetical protein
MRPGWSGGAGGEGGRGGAPADRCGAGPPALDGAGLAAGVRGPGGAGPAGVHRAGRRPGGRPSAAGPGGYAAGRRGRRSGGSVPSVGPVARWQGQDGDPLFPGRRGGRLSRDAVAARVARYRVIASQTCSSLADKTVSPHTLRHSNHGIAARRRRHRRPRALARPR